MANAPNEDVMDAEVVNATPAVRTEAMMQVRMGREPEDVLGEAARAASALTVAIERSPLKPIKFGPGQHLRFEHWQTCGRFFELSPQVESVEFVEYGDAQGFNAKAKVVHVPTGRVVSSAESMCLSDEANWHNKPLFQLRSMAQTRAMAKALRGALAWVVVLAGYAPTPAEEMESMERAAPATKPAAKPVSRPAAAASGAPSFVSNGEWDELLKPPSLEDFKPISGGKKKWGINTKRHGWVGVFDEGLMEQIVVAFDAGTTRFKFNVTKSKDGKYKNLAGVTIAPDESAPVDDAESAMLQARAEDSDLPY